MALGPLSDSLRLSMIRPRFRILFTLLMVAVLLVGGGMMPRRLVASPVADFVAPMSPQEARTRVAVAQQSDTQRRDEVARQLGATSAAALPLVRNIYFSETQHHVSDRAGFLSFWRE